MKRIEQHRNAKLKIIFEYLKTIFKELFSLYFIFQILIYSNCNKFGDTGIQKLNPVPKFKNIQIEGNYEIILVHSDTNSVEINCNSKIYDKIDFKVLNDTLKISNEKYTNNFFSDNEKINIRIGFDTLNSVSIFSSCKIECSDTVKSSNFNIFISKSIIDFKMIFETSILKIYSWNSSGIYELSGKTDYFFADNFGNGIIDAKSLYSGSSYVNNYSTGDCEIYAADLLNYSIFGDGDINCFSIPAQIIGFSKSEGKLNLPETIK